jgi:hypothetical protein
MKSTIPDNRTNIPDSKFSMRMRLYDDCSFWKKHTRARISLDEADNLYGLLSRALKHKPEGAYPLRNRLGILHFQALVFIRLIYVVTFTNLDVCADAEDGLQEAGPNPRTALSAARHERLPSRL